MGHWRVSWAIGAVLAMLLGVRAEAHKPLQIGGVAQGHTRQTAQLIAEPDVSWVLYLERRQPDQVDFFRFLAYKGSVIPIQLGVPRQAELEHFRPMAVLMGPGLPAATLPSGLELGPGEGAVVLRFDQEPPPTFFEPFTRTTSWVTAEYRTPLPSSGLYYVAVIDPSGELGKYFLAIGQREAFGLNDLLAMPEVIRKVRRFYGL